MSVTVWKDEASGLWYFRHPNPARGEDRVTRADRTIIALAQERDAMAECVANYVDTVTEMAERIGTLEAALNDLLIGAVQQSQSHADVIAKARAVLG